MSRPSTEEIRYWVGLTVLDSEGQQIGRCTRAYADDETGQSEWLAVELEAGQDSVLVPVRDASRNGDDVRVAFARTIVANSPTIGSPTFVSLEDEGRLYSHYGIPTPSEDESGAGAGRSRNRLVRMVGGDSAPVTTSTGTSGPDVQGTSVFSSTTQSSGESSTVGDLTVSSTPAAGGSDTTDVPPYTATSDAASGDAGAGTAAQTEQLGAGGAPAPASTQSQTYDWQEESASSGKGKGKGKGKRAVTFGAPAGVLALLGVVAARLLRRRRRQKALAAQRKSFGRVASVVPVLGLLTLVLRALRKRRSAKKSAPAPVTIDQSRAPVISTTTTAALPDTTDMSDTVGGTGTTGVVGVDDAGPVADLPAGSSQSGRRRLLRNRRSGRQLS